MGQRARVEAVVDQRQPGLLERMVDSALRGPNPTRYDAAAFFGNSLFQLMLPLGFKSAVRKSDNLILVLDDSSANLPWEMLETDGVPMIKRTRLVRQFITQRYRREVVRTDLMNACVIGDPDTQGYFKQFRPKGDGPWPGGWWGCPVRCAKARRSAACWMARAIPPGVWAAAPVPWRCSTNCSPGLTGSW